MHLLDPDKQLFDWISFDGASNVQKAGSLIEQDFPSCTVSIGVEHIESLLFGKVMAVHPIKEMWLCKECLLPIVCVFDFALSNNLFLMLL
jgi:hypothetical protein